MYSPANTTERAQIEIFFISFGENENILSGGVTTELKHSFGILQPSLNSILFFSKVGY
jgi:hypothetical protein